MSSEKTPHILNLDAARRQCGPASEKEVAARAAIEARAGRPLSDLEWSCARSKRLSRPRQHLRQDGTLQTTLFEPFEILRRLNQESCRKEKEIAGSGQDLENWPPGQDTSRIGHALRRCHPWAQR